MVKSVKRSGVESGDAGWQACHCEEAAGRRGALSAKREEVPLGCNLGKAVTFSPGLSCYPPRYCEIATAPLGPRNDKLEGLAPQNACRKDCQPARRSLSAQYGAIQRQKGAGAPPYSPDVSLRGGAADVAISQYHVE